MDRLGPFEPQPFLAVAVSGGADSMAAALLTRDWARGRGGDVLALVVDHGLRPLSADEALMTCERLAEQDIASVLLTLQGLARGPGLAARARAARHAMLEEQCGVRGILHLVFGHHAADQAETVCMRMLARSGPAGLAGMAAVAEASAVRRLRPLLGMSPGALRATLHARGVGWVEDPSNADPSQQRARIRALRADPAGDGQVTRALVASARARGSSRTASEVAWISQLARRASLHPEGYAHLSSGPVEPAVLAVLVAGISGSARPPSIAEVRLLAEAPRAATLGGVRLLPAGRIGPGWLLVREEAAMQTDIPARIGARWDNRFRLVRPPAGWTTAQLRRTRLGAWGGDAPRDRNGLPSAVLCTLPVLRQDGRVVQDWHALAAGPVPVILRHVPLPPGSAPFFPLPPVSG